MTTSIATPMRIKPVPCHCRPAYMIVCLVLGDVLSLAVSGLVAILLKLISAGHLSSWPAYLRLAPLLPVFVLVYSAIGLYSGISMGSPEELRRLTLSSILVSLLLGVLTLSFRGTGTLFTGTMMHALMISVVL